MPSFRLEACIATSCSFSIRATRSFQRVSSRATAQPTTPPPITATSKLRPSKSSSRTAGSFMGGCGSAGQRTSFTRVYLPRAAHRRPASTTSAQLGASPVRVTTPFSYAARTAPPKRAASFLFSLRTEGMYVSSFPSMSASWPTLCLQFTPPPPKNQPAGCTNSCLTCWAGCFILKENSGPPGTGQARKGRFGYGRTAGRKREGHDIGRGGPPAARHRFWGAEPGADRGRGRGQQGHPLLLLFQQGRYPVRRGRPLPERPAGRISGLGG